MNKTKTSKIKQLVYTLMFLSVIGLLALPLLPPLEQKSAVGAATARVEFMSLIKEGFAELQMPLLSASSTSTQVSTAVDSMTTFMETRSGLRISPLVKQQLVNAEIATLRGEHSLIGFDKLVDSMTDGGLEQISKLTDAEVEKMVTTAQGFDALGLPAKIKASRNSSNSMIAIKPGYYVFMARTEAVSQVKELRSPRIQFFAKSSIRSMVEQELKRTLVDLATAVPEQFGGNWDLNQNKPAKGLTPSQCMLVSYSLVSGDFLARNTATLQTQMRRLHIAGIKKYGDYPSPIGYSPFGNNGYLHSSPTDELFNEQAQITLLNNLIGKE